MTSDRPASRRRYSAELKAQVLTECDTQGASVAKVAMAHGINSNVVHRWRQLAREGQASAPVSSSEFVALALPAVAPMHPSTRDIEIQLRRGATTMSVTWPASQAAECAAWVRELLR